MTSCRFYAKWRSNTRSFIKLKWQRPQRKPAETKLTWWYFWRKILSAKWLYLTPALYVTWCSGSGIRNIRPDSPLSLRTHAFRFNSKDSDWRRSHLDTKDVPKCAFTVVHIYTILEHLQCFLLTAHPVSVKALLWVFISITILCFPLLQERLQVLAERWQSPETTWDHGEEQGWGLLFAPQVFWGRFSSLSSQCHGRRVRSSQRSWCQHWRVTSGTSPNWELSPEMHMWSQLHDTVIVGWAKRENEKFLSGTWKFPSSVRRGDAFSMNHCFGKS